MARIFVYDDGKPIKFHITEGLSANKIMKLIKENGGAVTAATDANFRLQFDDRSHTAGTLRSSVVNATWITDCCEQGRKLSTFQYQFNADGLVHLEELNRNRAEIIKEELTNGHSEQMYTSLHRRLPHLTSRDWKELYTLHADSNQPIIDAWRKLKSSIEAEAEVRLREGTLSLLVDNLSTVLDEIPSRFIDSPPPETVGPRRFTSIEDVADNQSTEASSQVDLYQPVTSNASENEDESNSVIELDNDSLAELDALLLDVEEETRPAPRRPKGGQVNTTRDDSVVMAKFSVDAGLMKDNTLRYPSTTEVNKFMVLHDKEGKRTPKAWKSTWRREAGKTQLMREIHRYLRTISKSSQVVNASTVDDQSSTDRGGRVQPSPPPLKVLRRTHAEQGENIAKDIKAVAKFLRASGKELLMENILEKAPTLKHWQEFIETDTRGPLRLKGGWNAFFRSQKQEIIKAANEIPQEG